VRGVRLEPTRRRARLSPAGAPSGENLVPRLHFVINSASGGGEGARLAGVLAALHGATSVSLLGRVDLAALVAQLTAVDAVVACGGDGTASAVAEVLARRGAAAPALGLVPLGTGNDLGRVCGWSGWDRRDLPGLVAALAVARRRRLDRWRLETDGWQRTWCNYLSLGEDARIAQRFHRLRLRHPHVVRGTFVNRSLYGALGAVQVPHDLTRVVRLPSGPRLPPWTGALVLANIPSYAGGVELAGDMRVDDGRFELVALGHGPALALVTCRLRRPRLLARRGDLRLEVGGMVAAQADGEPFALPRGRYRVVPAPSVAVLVAGGALCGA
jgi:diacylglycerol kinase (ATP)